MKINNKFMPTCTAYIILNMGTKYEKINTVYINSIKIIEHTYSKEIVVYFDVGFTAVDSDSIYSTKEEATERTQIIKPVEYDA
jgi:hypothetical protein